MTTATTEEKSASKAETDRPSVLTDLGLGNDLPPAKEGADVTTQSPGPGVEAVAPAASVEPKSETKTDAKAETPPDKDDPKETVKKLEKQLKDTRDAFTQERQVNKTLIKKQEELDQKLTVLTKKFDGTYDETKDAPKGDDPAVAAAKAVQAERVKASHWAAVDRYGEDYVMKTIWADDAPFRQFDGDEAVQARVFSAHVPILEAIKVVKEAEAKAKYGADPESMRKAIEQEVRATVEKEVRQQVLAELKKGSPVETIHGLGGKSGVGDKLPEKKPALVFESLFPNFTKATG